MSARHLTRTHDTDHVKHRRFEKCLTQHQGSVPADLRREISAGFELLERDGHGVSAEEQNEGQERQIRDIFTGFAHQRPAEPHTVFLIQLTPVHRREV